MAKQSTSGKKKRPSMNDVAKLAGVSQTTVSFVMNSVEGENIPPETQERVWAAVKELGYRPNAIARGLRSSRTHTIGFVTDQIAITPYAGKIFEGAQDVAWEHNKILVLVNTKGVPDVEQAAVDMLLEQQVEGIIYATMYHRAVNLPDSFREVPTVLLDCFSTDRSLPSVVPDEVSGGQQATEILLEKGHRRIGFINNKDQIPATTGRLEGYQKALSAYGVPFDESLVCADESIPNGGYRCTQKLMQLPDPPTALFCFNDRMAMGAYDALRKMNLTIPDDVAVMGFDNQETIAAYLSPPLSTMELPHYRMGQWAGKYLIEHTGETGTTYPLQHMIECPHIKRASV